MLKVTCPYCHLQWHLTPENLALAAEKTPPKSKSIAVECPRCRKTVKIARPKHIPPLPNSKNEE